MASFTVRSATLASASNQYFSATDNAALSITGDLTIEFWLKLASTPSSGNQYALVTKSVGTGSQRAYNFVYQNNGGTPRLFVTISADGGAINLDSKGQNYTFSTGTWYHVAFVFTASSSKYQFFVNAVQQGADQNGAHNTIFDSTAPFQIGKDDGTGYLDGQIDDVRVWATTRTATQLSNNKSVELVGNETNLQGYWKLNETSGNAADSTSNATTLTNNGTITYTTDVPYYATFSSSDTVNLDDAETVIKEFVFSGSDTVNIADDHSMKFGWQNLSKNSGSWTNLAKS